MLFYTLSAHIKKILFTIKQGNYEMFYSRISFFPFYNFLELMQLISFFFCREKIYKINLSLGTYLPFIALNDQRFVFQIRNKIDWDKVMCAKHVKSRREQKKRLGQSPYCIGAISLFFKEKLRAPPQERIFVIL